MDGRTDRQTDILMVDSTKVLCPLFDEIEILIPSDRLARAFPTISGQNVKFYFVTETRKMTLLKQFIKHEWVRKGVMSIPLFQVPRTF